MGWPRWLGILAALLAILAWMVWEWQPRRAVERQAARLLDAAAARDWKRVGSMMDEQYHDAWHACPADALESARLLGGHFFSLHIGPREPPDVRVEGRAASWSARLEFMGRGNPIGEELLEEASALSSPFFLEWRRRGWQPWSWKLVTVSQAELTSSYSR